MIFLLLLLLAAIGGLMQAATNYVTIAASATAQLAFGYLLLTAFLTGKIVNRLGLPKLTGYIISGVVSGPFVLGLVDAPMTKSLSIVSGAATAIIALEAGLELRLSSVRRVARTLRAITLLAVVGAMFVLGGTVYLLSPYLPFLQAYEPQQAAAVAMVLGVALSAQSPAVVMALLAELRAAGPVSEILLASVVVADLVVIVCFSIASAVCGALIGSGIDPLVTARDVGWEIFGSIGFGLLVGGLLGLFLRLVQSGAPVFALAICVIVAEAGPRVHLDPLIMMLTAGLWVSNFSRADTAVLLSGFEAAQLPVFLVFFALAGAKLDLDILTSSFVPIAILASARAASFFVGGKLATAITGAPPLVRKYAWFGLVPQAGLALALALVMDKTFPTFGKPASVIMIGVVGFNELIAPVILRAMLLRTGESGKKQGGDFAAGGH
ncbi:MAG TPA: cation:proton antiporter [Kofleriaceae bacterium]|nr:cation:proton antiporter [Kofleriaceae bacterium]